jgi:hypothetical protein
VRRIVTAVTPGVVVGLVLGEGEVDEVLGDGLSVVGDGLVGDGDVGEGDDVVGLGEVDDAVGDGEGLHAASSRAAAAAGTRRIGFRRRLSMVLTTPDASARTRPPRAYVSPTADAPPDGPPSGWRTA